MGCAKTIFFTIQNALFETGVSFDRVSQKSQPSSARCPKSSKLLNTFASLETQPPEANCNEMRFATGISPTRVPRSAHAPPFTTAAKCVLRRTPSPSPNSLFCCFAKKNKKRGARASRAQKAKPLSQKTLPHKPCHKNPCPEPLSARFQS